MSTTCANCRFMRFDPGTPLEASGYCHASPPMHVPTKSPSEERYASWPRVRSEWFCGSHKHKHPQGEFNPDNILTKRDGFPEWMTDEIKKDYEAKREKKRAAEVAARAAAKEPVDAAYVEKANFDPRARADELREQIEGLEEKKGTSATTPITQKTGNQE